MKKKLCVLGADAVFQVSAVRAELENLFELSYWDEGNGVELIDACRRAEVVLMGRRSPMLPAALEEDFGELKYACYCFGSIRSYVGKGLIERGLLVTNWGNAVEGVAESAMALLLGMLKQLKTLDRFIRSGWRDDQRVWQGYRCTLKGMDVGLYGFGPIGKHMGRMLEPFGARIAIYDPYATEVPGHVRRCSTLRELFSTCQAISIHCGLNAETEKSVTGELLDLLPQGGIVVNTARGKIVDEAALTKRVGTGRLLAGLDVLEDEKGWEKSELAKMDGAILTGHVLGQGKGYPPGQSPEPKLPEYVSRNLAAYARGEGLIHVVRAEEYDRKT